MKKIAIVLSLLGIVSGSLTGCTNSNTATNTGTQSKNVNRDLRSVAVTLGDLSNPFFVVMGKEAEEKAKKIGGNDSSYCSV